MVIKTFRVSLAALANNKAECPMPVMLLSSTLEVSRSFIVDFSGVGH